MRKKRFDRGPRLRGCSTIETRTDYVIIYIVEKEQHEKHGRNATRLEAIASRLEAIPVIRLEVIASRLEATTCNTP